MLKTYEYKSADIDGTVRETKEGDFPSDTYFELKNERKASLRIDGQMLEAGWTTAGESSDMKLYLNPSNYTYSDVAYYILFPVGGFDVLELSDTRLVLYAGQYYGVGINEFQTLVLEK